MFNNSYTKPERSPHRMSYELYASKLYLSPSRASGVRDFPARYRTDSWSLRNWRRTPSISKVKS